MNGPQIIVNFFLLALIQSEGCEEELTNNCVLAVITEPEFFVSIQSVRMEENNLPFTHGGTGERSDVLKRSGLGSSGGDNDGVLVCCLAGSINEGTQFIPSWRRSPQES